MSILGAALLLVSSVGLSAEAPVAVKMDFSPKKITIGDQVKIRVAVEAPAGVKLAPPPSASIFGEWEVLDYRALPGKAGDAGKTVSEYEWTMTVWTTGKIAVPSLRFAYVNGAGKPGYADTLPALVEVESILAREKDPQDLRPPKGLIGYRNIWPYIWAALAVLGVSFLIWWWQKRRKRMAAIAAGILPGVPVKPAEDIAREALDELATSGLAESGEVKVFYIRLSDILRRYIEGKFGIPAMDRTTAELMPEIRRHSALNGLNSEFRAFFDDCDLAKFAKYVPSVDDIATDLARARRVVDATSAGRPA